MGMNAFDNVNKDIARKYLAVGIHMPGTTFADLGGTEPSGATGAAPFEIIGYRVPDASIEISSSTTTERDILGDDYTNVDSFEKSITFEPYRLNVDRTKMAEKLLRQTRGAQSDSLSGIHAVIVYAFLTEEDTPINELTIYTADIYSGCTIIPNRIGGSLWLEMPFTVNFGGKFTEGFASGIRGLIVASDKETGGIVTDSRLTYPGDLT